MYDFRGNKMNVTTIFLGGLIPFNIDQNTPRFSKVQIMSLPTLCYLTPVTLPLSVNTSWLTQFMVQSENDSR